MGNEESQPGAPGQPQGPGGPMGMGGPGPPRMTGPGPPRGPGPPAGGAGRGTTPRATGPTLGSVVGGGLNTLGGLLAGGGSSQQQQVKPVAQYPAGPDSIPRGRGPGSMGGPVQVGVQPWADPPVQQPQPAFRGAAPPRGQTPQQHQMQTRPTGGIQPPGRQQQPQPIQITAKQQQQAMDELGVDLSNLSEEEKHKILSVMLKAHDMEEDLQRHKRAKDDGVGAEQRRAQLLCPACRAVDLAVETNKMCGDCGKNFCQKCGTFVPGEGRRSVWVCNGCSISRKEHSAAMATTQQQQESSSNATTYSTAGGQKMMDQSRREDAMSREYEHHLHPDSSVDDVVSISPTTESADTTTYYMIEEEDISDIRDLNGNGFAARSSRIRSMLEEELEDDEDEEDDMEYVVDRVVLDLDDLEEEEDLAEDEKLMQSASTTTMLQAIPYYDRSPGEVYTIPEEEEDMMSPQNNAAWKVSADCSELNSDTASSLLRWRGVGQTFQQPGQQPQLQPQLQLQQPQQQQQQQPVQMGVSFQPGNATPIMGGVMQTDHQSTSLIGGASVTTSSTTGFASGSLLQGVSVVPTSVGGVGSGGVKAGGSLVGAIPRTVPLMSLSQSLQQPDLTQQQMQWQQNQQLQPQQQTPQMQQQWGMQPGQSQLTPQTLQQQQPQLQSSPKLKPKGIELASGSLGQQPQKLKASQKAKDQQQQQLQSSEWSPVSDLSPIMDVSPSLEAAEQEMMEKCQGDPTRPSIPRATSGTISGMLADFNKALGLATTPVDEAPRGTSSLLGSQIGHQTLGPPQATVPLGTVTMASTATANTSVVVTDVDQNQNMVNQQFQLQQQQMMIQQQQQMIQQQQQQLQQQAQIQQIQIHHQQMQPQTLQQQQQFQQQQQQFPQQQFQPQQQMQQQQTQLQPQQPLQQPQMSTVGQPGIIMGAQTQTQQARKVHRRLPQPTTEQMQAAVAIAAQTPRSKPRPLGGPTPSLQRPVSPMMPPRKGTDTQLRYGGVGLSGNGATGQALLGAPTVVTSLSTTPISPTPQQRMESDTTSESESGKAGKIRRRLPPVPLDQEPTPIPRRTSSKDRTRTLSMGATPLSYSDRSWDRRTPHRTTSLDGGMSLTNALTTLTSTSAAGFDYSSLFLPTSTSSISSAVDNYLQYLTTSASQLTGALSSQASVLAGISSSLGIGPTSVTSMLGRRDLSAPHSLSSYLRSAPASYLLDHPLSAIDRHHPLSTSLDSATMVGGGSKLPSYMMSLKHQLREELRSVSEDRRRITDPDLSGLLSHSTWPLSAQDSVGGYDHLRKGPALSLGSTGRPTAPPGSPRRNRHRRHASDTKLALYSSPLARDEFLDEPVSSRFKHQTQFGGLPFKSFEFESIDDHLRRGMGGSGGLLGGSAYRAEGSLLPRGAAAYRRFDMDPRLASQFGGGTTPKTPEQIRRYNRQMARLRRHTDTGLTGLSSLSQLGLGLDPYGRSSSAYATYGGSSGFYGGPFGGVVVGGRRRGRGGGGMVPVVPGRKPSRSWHPSPYVSEDEEEDQRTEEKKAKIKAEIARRRQQIEERLHDELYKLARVRDGTDRGYVVSPAYSLGGGGGDRLYTSPISLESGSSPRSQGSDALSVLHSIDDILRKDTFHYRRGEQPLSYYTTAPSSSAYATDHRQHRSQQRYDRYYDPYYDSVDDRGVVDHYESMDPYDPMLEYGSPMITPTETTPAMPLLPDMPTRSRKILEDLGSSPIVSTTSTSSPRHHHQRSSTRSAQPYDDYIDHRGVDDRASRHPPHHQQQSQRHQPVDRPDAVPPGNRSRKPQNSKAFQKYEFPVKRILLTRDPKDRSVSGNGLGMKVVGGKEIPGSNGMIGAYVARIYPGGVVETLGEVREGDQVLEWNGVQLTGKTYEEVQRIIASSGDEVEIVIRSDFNMLSSRSSSHHHQNDRHHHQQNRQQQQHHSQSSSSRLREGPTEGGSGGGNSRVSHSRSNYQQQQQHQDGGSYNTRSSDSRYNRNYDSADFLQSPVDEEVHNSNYNTYRDSERNTYSSPTRGYNSRTPHIGKRSPPPKGDYSESNKFHFREEKKVYRCEIQRVVRMLDYTDRFESKKHVQLLRSEKYRAENISGEIQLQVCYDSKATILYVTIVRARNLVTSRDNSGLPDPFVKCYLLPDRCVENERRTRYFSRCSDPEWKQTMVYPNVPQDQLKKKYLEISVYNYDINRPSEFLGEVILDLKDNSVIDEQSRWYKLHPHDPKKYPGGGNAVTCTTLNNESSTKMARLNNPGQKALYFDTGEDIRKFNNSEKQFFKQLIKKPTATDNYTKASEQPAMADTYIAHWKPDGPSLVTTRVPRRHLYCPLRIQTQNPITQTLNLPMGPVISVK